MNKQQLASKIWESANRMRSKIEASEYKDYILGFMFYKFLSEKEEQFLIEEGFSEEDKIETLNEENQEVLDYVRQEIGYFISYENLFSTWVNLGKDFSVDNVNTALSAFDRLINNNFKKIFDGVFTTLQTGLSKLGDTSGARTKAIIGLIELINDIPMDGKQGYDVLGFVYEYLISMFAANAGKKAGEFYTPHEVSILMSEIVAEHLKDRETIKIYDPTSGSGSLLINIGDSVAKRINKRNGIKYYAQELKENTFNLTRMNLIMRGIIPTNITVRNADTLEDDWPYFDDSDPAGTYEPLYVDAVVSNPPYSQTWDPQDKEADKRFKKYGLAPKSKADYAFLLHDLFHIKSDGIMTIVLPHGVLFRGGEEGQIRKNLIENNKIDAIIGLPANIFFGTGIPTIIMVLKQNRPNNDVLIIDASKGYIKEGKNNKLRACDIKKIADCVNNRTSIEKFSKLVDKDTIRSNDYNLNIPRYVDSSEEPEAYDLYASMNGGIPNSEIDKFHLYWEQMPTLKGKLFSSINDAYSELKCEDVKTTIFESEEVQQLKTKFNDRFADLDSYLYDLLINNIDNIEIQSAENEISNNLLERMQDNKIIDFYSVYQVLDDKWKDIAVDLEILQTEGIKALNVVDPNMVMKKKNGKDVETQEGNIGRVLPFDLVQIKFLSELLQEIEDTENDLAATDSNINDNIDLLDEDVKDKVLNDKKDAFKLAELKKEIKENINNKNTININMQSDDSTEKVLMESMVLLEKQKQLKSKIKRLETNLTKKTIDLIENLSTEDALSILKTKWIDQLKEGIEEVFSSTLDDFVSGINELAKKYETTLREIDDDIKKTEQSLAAMLNDLTGDEYNMQGINELRSLLGCEE